MWLKIVRLIRYNTQNSFKMAAARKWLMTSIKISRVCHLLADSGGIKGGMGAFAPLVRGSAPHMPPNRKEKMAKISYFQQFFWFLPPQISILPPRCPPTKNFLVPPLLADVECGQQSIFFRLFFFFFNENSNFQYHIWIKHENYIKMSTNKPSIGRVVLEIDTNILRKLINWPGKNVYFLASWAKFPSGVGWLPLCISLFFSTKSQDFPARSFPFCLFFPGLIDQIWIFETSIVKQHSV